MISSHFFENSTYLQAKTVSIAFCEGDVSVHGCVPDSWAAGLCISMMTFGMFTVTHINSGMRISRVYDRAIDALLTLTHWAIIAREYKFSWSDVTVDTFAEHVKWIMPYPIPREISDEAMTIKEWTDHIRTECYVKTDVEEKALYNINKILEER